MIKKMYNPFASRTNTTVIEASDAGCCPGETLVACKYSSANCVPSTITGVVFVSAKTGLSVTKTFTAPTSKGNLIDKLIEAYESEGYIVEGTDAINIQSNSGTPANYDISVVSEANTTAFIISGSPVATVTACTKVSVCEYQLVTGDIEANTVFTDNGSDSTVGPWEYGTTSAASVRTAVLGAVAGEKSVTVTLDTVNEAYVITIKHYNGKEFILDGKPFQKCCCVVDYE